MHLVTKTVLYLQAKKSCSITIKSNNIFLTLCQNIN
jgi:hypothetical protein